MPYSYDFHLIDFSLVVAPKYKTTVQETKNIYQLLLKVLQTLVNILKYCF